MKNNNFLSKVFILLALLFIVFSFYAPVFFTNKKVFIDTGQIGDTIGGLMNPFIAIAGVIVTGLAFYMQYLANKIQVENFEKTQKDQLEQANKDLFIRLIDNLNLKVQNYTISSPSFATIGQITGEHGYEIKGYSAIDHIYKYILKEMNRRLTSLGYFALAKYPEQIDISQYQSIVMIVSDDLLSLKKRAESFKLNLLDIKSYSERHSYLVSFLANNQNQKVILDDRLNTLAILYFSKLDFSLRNSAFYQVISMDIIDKFGSFMNSYAKSIEYILEYTKDNDGEFYKNYFLSNLSYHEKFILFYYCGSRKVSASLKQKLLTLNVFEGSFIKSKDMLIADEELMKQEINFVLKNTDTIF